MNYQDFDKVVMNQYETCLKLLANKAKEYAPDTEDRLSAFKTAAALQNRTPIQCLGGQMSKHTVSIYEMIEQNSMDLDLWQEKLTDSQNYLFLLKGLILDEYQNMEATGASESRLN